MRRAALLLGLWPVLAVAVEREAPSERLRQLDEQQHRIESTLKEVESKRTHVLEVLDRIDHERHAAEQTARDANKEKVRLTAALSEARNRELAIETQRRTLAHDIGPRLTLRYQMKTGSYFQTILSATSLGDLLWRRRMMDRILTSDLTLISRWALMQQAEAAARTEVETQQLAVVQAEATAQRREADARSQAAVQKAVLSKVIQQKGTLADTLAGMERSRESLQRTIQTLPAPPSGLGGFGRAKGHLPWPVSGTVEVKFGRQVDRKFRTVLRQKGYDLRAGAGAPVIAPYAGLVGFAGWFSGFGNLVILDHGEGYYTLYAHLGSLGVAKGQQVTAGTPLGEVGDTGS